jgi:hypothetical protein
MLLFFLESFRFTLALLSSRSGCISEIILCKSKAPCLGTPECFRSKILRYDSSFNGGEVNAAVYGVNFRDPFALGETSLFLILKSSYILNINFLSLNVLPFCTFEKSGTYYYLLSLTLHLHKLGSSGPMDLGILQAILNGLH